MDLSAFVYMYSMLDGDWRDIRISKLQSHGSWVLGMRMGGAVATLVIGHCSRFSCRKDYAGTLVRCWYAMQQPTFHNGLMACAA